MIKQVTKWQAEDGSLHNSPEDARKCDQRRALEDIFTRQPPSVQPEEIVIREWAALKAIMEPDVTPTADGSSQRELDADERAYAAHRKQHKPVTATDYDSALDQVNIGEYPADANVAPRPPSRLEDRLAAKQAECCPVCSEPKATGTRCPSCGHTGEKGE